RNSTHIRSLVDTSCSLTGCHVHGLQRAWHGRNRLHGSTHAQLLTIGHAPFQTTSAVSEMVNAVFSTHHFIVGLWSWAATFFTAIANFHTLDGLDADQCRSQLRIQAVIARDVRAQADRKAIDNNLNDAAEGIALLLRLFNL